MTSRGYEQPATQQPMDAQAELVRMATRTMQATEQIRTTVIIWALGTLLFGFAALMLVLSQNGA